MRSAKGPGNGILGKRQHSVGCNGHMHMENYMMRRALPRGRPSTMAEVVEMLQQQPYAHVSYVHMSFETVPCAGPCRGAALHDGGGGGAAAGGEGAGAAAARPAQAHQHDGAGPLLQHARPPRAAQRRAPTRLLTCPPPNRPCRCSHLPGSLPAAPSWLCSYTMCAGCALR